jgi:hypothetical protein
MRVDNPDARKYYITDGQCGIFGSAKDTLFPEKVARAKRILSNTKDL